MNKQEIQKMLRHVEQDDVYSFISAYAELHAEFCKQLKEALIPDKGGDLNKKVYQAKAEDCFNFGGSGWRRNNYDFEKGAYNAASGLDNMLFDADYLIEQGKYASAAGIAMVVAEVIPRNYEKVDDSSGSLSQTFDRATECLVSILHAAPVPKGLKEKINEWVKQEMNEPVYSDYGFDSLTDVYDAACEELGETDEVLAYLDQQIEEVSDGRKESVVLRKIRFMQSRNLDTYAVIEKYIEMDDVRKIRFDQMMESGLYADALVLARSGVELINTQNHWSTTMNWDKSMLEIYLRQGDVKNILLQAEDILYKNYYNEDEYYQIIKKYTPPKDWAKTLERMLESFENLPYFRSFAAELMVEYQLWKRLLAYCKKGYDIASTIEEYEPDLKSHLGKEVLSIYHEYVEEQALIARNSAYDRVARVLKRMRTFDGGDDLVDELLEKYRSIYNRRRNMMFALENV